MNLDDVVAKVCYNLSEAGLREQIEIDRRAIEREWAKDNPNLDVILRLSAHVELCKQRLAA